MDSILKNFTILYVEDEQTVASMVSEVLTDIFKTVYVASNGADGLEIFKSKSPDMILSDIIMPKMNGLEMIRKIKETNDDIPTVMLTAMSDINLLLESIDLGVDGYVIKPVLDFEKLFKPLMQIAKKLQAIKENEENNKLLQIQNTNNFASELITNIAHQWRQPLGIISSSVSNIYIKLQLQENISDELLYDCIDSISSQTRYLSSTIDDFNKFIFDGNQGFSQVNLKEYLNTLFQSSFEFEYLKDIEFIINLDDSHNAWVNPTHLLQIFLNIFKNSKDFFDLKHTPKRFIVIDSAKIDDNIQIEIYDNAGGVAQEIISKVFEPYFTTKHQTQGKGLGLFGVYQLIKNTYHGSLSGQNHTFVHQNQSYTGFKITFTLPQAKS